MGLQIVLLWFMSSLLVSCANKVETSVPAKIEHCFKDDATQKCTSEITVKHVVTIEMPTQFIQTCEDKYKDTPEPEKTILIQECISGYTDQIISIINGINPVDLPPIPPVP
jgi:hypothetical protein